MARALRANPVAIRRAIYADGWLGRYRRAMRRALDAQVRRVAARAAAGEQVIIDDAEIDRWAAEMDRAKRDSVHAMVRDGFGLAGREFPAPAKALGRSPGPDAPMSIAVGEGEEFLIRADFVDVDKWVETTSLSESRTSAKKLEGIFTQASRSVKKDVEGRVRGTTPREIAREILRKGLADGRARADMLARTGTIWAFNEGAQQRYRAEGVTVEEWMVTVDDATCFPGDARISIPGGTMPIEGIRAGDMVQTRSGPRAVVRMMSRLYKGSFAILTSRAGTLTCTRDHLIWARSTGWTKAEKIQEGDVLSLARGEEAKVLLETHITCQVEAMVYNLEIEGDHTFYANGVLVHNCEYCMSMDKRRVRVDEPFMSAGESMTTESPAGRPQTLDVPFDVQHPPLHPRCRCTMVPVLPELPREVVVPTAVKPVVPTVPVVEVPPRKPVPEFVPARTVDEGLKSARKMLPDTRWTIEGVESAELNEIAVGRLNRATNDLARMRREYPAFDTWAKWQQNLRSVNIVVNDTVVYTTAGEEVTGYYSTSKAIRLARGRSAGSPALRLGGEWNIPRGGFDGHFRHEVGHAFHGSIKGTPFEKQWSSFFYDQPSEYWESKVSRYASTNPKEAFAESFSAFTNKEYGIRQRLPKDVEKFFTDVLKKTGGTAR